MNDDDKRAIFQELIDSIRSPTREDYPQPNITVDEYAATVTEKISKASAYNALESGVRKGILKKAVDVKVGDHACNIYWRA